MRLGFVVDLVGDPAELGGVSGFSQRYSAAARRSGAVNWSCASFA
jgi:hypothetical protein